MTRPPAHADVVVVTGLHRSGTTFLSRVLETAQDVVPIGVEPLNPRWGLRSADEWYPVLPADAPTRTAAQRDLDRLISGHGVAWRVGGPTARRRLHSAWRARTRNARVRAAVDSGTTLLIKDPFLSLSLTYATHSISRRPVVIGLRHPSAWVLSLQRVDWHPGSLLNDLATRPQLAGDRRALDLPARDWRSVPLVDAAAWTWALLMQCVSRQVDDLPEASTYVLPLETLRESPTEVAVSLLDVVGLQASSDTVERVRKLTESSTVVPSDATTFVLERNTRAAIGAWRDLLDETQQARIWSISAPVAARYYTPEGLR